MRNALPPHTRTLWEANPLGDRVPETLRPEAGLPQGTLEAVPIQAPAELRVRILSESPYGARRLAAAVRSLAMPGIEWRDEAPACHRLERGEQGTGRPSTVDEGAGATVIFT